uniref:unconventional myosin-Va-like isoform X2 n=1 Tax=Styela clava TaxID=7725 RepID=UPI001939E038|nr:unconventional myosin-Va-like isoform X2 [Styela clava]
MTSVELYTQRARVWIPHPETVWRSATVLSDYKEGDKVLKIRTDDVEENLDSDGELGDEQDYILKEGKLPPLCNPDVLIGENDLTSLSYLHEPAVLHNLQIRFVERNQIYTYCGIVLVAINPYEELSIYSNDFIHLYSGHNMGEMDPHIFAIAEEAFKQMTRMNKNQSIIVTGESGAGKTVSAKYTMRYFATVGGSSLESQVEKKVLASNPIMEAIGNAKTTRNDNSSRFGKYIQISFNKNFHIIGAHMRTYLLEKSRVVSQHNAPDERNYHIFYQLCACADLPQFKPLKLMSAEHFEYTRVGNCTTIDNVDDQKEFQETVHALTLLGVSTKYQSLMFRIISAILHMGNIEIMEDERTDSCHISVEDPHLVTMCGLLGIEAQQMSKWFCNRKITTMAEVLIKPLTCDQALASRDALAKHIYAKLFEWIVDKINNALITQEKPHSFVGVLDIYGFETFEINSFEQFCINYANEKLQQQFCQHVFKLEQEEYVREKIEWKFIDFTDNQPCIDLIEKKLGILDLLDDECRMPKGSDISWVQKLYDKHLKTSNHFEKPRTSTTAFVIVHFADNVRYEVEGFLEKNRDTVHEEQLNILKASQYELVAELFIEKEESSHEVKAGVGKHGVKMVKQTSLGGKPKGRGGKEMRKTVGNQFQSSLVKLMTILNSTTPHYVRCIKPNDYKQSFTFEPKRAVQQLRACGVLETIRISAAGYPSRWSYTEFHDRYRVLMRSKEIVRGKPRVTCENVLARLIPEPDKYQPGKTKIFFRAGQVAYLEKLRADKLRACAIMVQKHIRGWLCKKQYLKKRNAAMILQRYARGMKARRHANFLRRTKAAIQIQRTWRGYVSRSKYTRTWKAIVKIQSFIRGLLARILYRKMLRNAKATILQAHIRGWLVRIRYNKQLKAIVYLQCCVRRMYAKRELKALKIEARSIGHFKKLNQGMENKIVELQRKLDTANKETKSLLTKAVEADNLRQKVQKLEKVEQDAKQTQEHARSLEEEIEHLRKLLEESQAETKIVKDELEKEKNDKDEAVAELTNEKEHLVESLAELKDEMEALKVESQKQLEESVLSAKTSVEEELEKERSSHQARIKEYNRLEQRYDNLKDELELTRSQAAAAAEATSGDPGSNASSAPPSPPESAYNSINTNASDVMEVQNLQNGSGSHESVNLLGRMQKKVKELEFEKRELQQKVLEKMQEHAEEEENRKIEMEERESESERERTVAFADGFKLEEVEKDNEKMKQELTNLRKSVADSASSAMTKDSSAFKEMYNQMLAMQEELEVRRSEVIQLKSGLASMKDSLQKYKKENVAKITKSTMTSADLLGSRNRMEDINVEKLDKNDLKTVLAKVYDHNRMLEAELEAERKNHDIEIEELHQRFNLLQTDSNREYLRNGDSFDGNIQLELQRLSTENFELEAQVESLEKQNRKLKRQLKLYNKKLNTMESEMGGTGIKPSESNMSLGVQNVKVNGDSDTHSIAGNPAVKHKDAEISGMLKYKKGEDSKAVKAIILDLKPRSVAVSLLPGLPAHLLFMLLRFADHRNDDSMIKSLLSHIINGIKKVEKQHEGEFEYISFWLANTCRFLHNMKQYSGDKEFLKDSTPAQQGHCLRNFDLSEYRQVISDMAISLYQKLVLLIMHEIKPMIVPAMLEHDTIQGLSSSVKPSGMRGRSSSRSTEPENIFTVESIIKQLTAYHITMNQHRMDQVLVQQVFKQVMYGITAHTINNQLLRKELCNWSKAMQIRYNVSQLEDWIRKSGLNEAGLRDMLEPLVQASQLLQVKKQSEQDALEICEMCSRLTPAQIVKLLNMITPTNDYEERVPVKFIKTVQGKLKQQRPDMFGGQQTLLMDNGFMFGVTFPYAPSTISLDRITIPESLNLGYLKLV